MYKALTEILRDDLIEIGYGEYSNEAENSGKELEIDFKLNSKEMNLTKPQVKFMGHVISKNAIKRDPDN